MSDDWLQPPQMRGQPQPETCFAEFYLYPVRMGARSEQEGREIFEDQEYVRILVPGDSKTVVERKATLIDKQRFPRQYDAFKQGAEAAHEGTPLMAWAVMSPARIRELNAVNIFTVEHLANLSDIAMQRVGMGARDLVTKAKAFLAQASDTAASQRYATENEQLRTDVERQEAEIRSLAAQLQALIQKEPSHG